MSESSSSDSLTDEPRGRLIYFWACLPVVVGLCVLAALTLPNILRAWEMSRTRTARLEMEAIHTQCIRILSDAGISDFTPLIEPRLENETPQQAIDRHTAFFYQLFVKGRTVHGPEPTGAYARLSQHYMDLGNDPWGNRYRFYAGHAEELIPEAGDRPVFHDYPTGQGGPRHRATQTPRPDAFLYIFSLGKNQQNDQPYTNNLQPKPTGDDLLEWL